MYERIDSGSTIKHYYYINSPEGPVALAIQVGSGVPVIYYLCKDHLGSITGIMNSIGNILEEYNYDPWGKRRNPADWSYSNVSSPTYTQRGFTGHEHIDMFNLINMNGRIYDSEIARFLSPDPIIQDPYNILSYNRYAYCLNNPLIYIDPSGYYKITLWEKIKAFFRTQRECSYNSNSGESGGSNGGSDGGSNGGSNSNSNNSSSPSLNFYFTNGMPYINTSSGVKTTSGGGSSQGNSNASLTELTKVSQGQDGVYYGNNIFFKTWTHYQIGFHTDLYVSTDALDFSFVSKKDLIYNAEKNTYSVNLFALKKNNQTSLALGKVSLNYIGNNLYTINSDLYDFNIEWKEGFSKRNRGTFIAGLVHGPVLDNYPIPIIPSIYGPSYYLGGYYNIFFIGTIYIKP